MVHNAVNGKIKKVACTQIFVLRNRGCLIVELDFERGRRNGGGSAAYDSFTREKVDNVWFKDSFIRSRQTIQ